MSVFTISSHGTYRAGTYDEEEAYDQAICPYDCADGLINDDELHNLFSQLPKGVKFTAICDTCFTGATASVAVAEVMPGLKTPDDRRVRFLSPLLLGGRELENTWRARPKGPVLYPQSWEQGLLLRGCGDKEYAYDACVNGEYHGVMSYFAIKAMSEANYKITYSELESCLHRLIDDAGYPQRPLIEGHDSSKKRQVFA